MRNFLFLILVACGIFYAGIYNYRRAYWCQAENGAVQAVGARVIEKKYSRYKLVRVRIGEKEYSLTDDALYTNHQVGDWVQIPFSTKLSQPCDVPPYTKTASIIGIGLAVALAFYGAIGIMHAKRNGA